MVEFKPFTDKTIDDAKSVVRQVFGESACSILDKAIANPALQEVPGSDAGEVLYMDGKPVGFNAAILRKLYYRQSPFWGVVGSTIGILPEARKDMAAFDLMAKVVKPRFGSELFFGNSANKAGMRVNKAFGMRANGPTSCGEKRIAVLRPLHFLSYLVWTKLLKHSVAFTKSRTKTCVPSFSTNGVTIKRMDGFDSQLFDGFWKTYIAGNRGLVASRTSAELHWMFGDRVAMGNALLCGAFCGSQLCGYIIFTCTRANRCWRVVDMIALGNGSAVLDALMGGGLKVLRKCTNAIHVEVSGFADWMGPAIAHCFQLRRMLTNNQFSWLFQKESSHEVSDEVMKSEQSWFFGPYDGDNCM